MQQKSVKIKIYMRFILVKKSRNTQIGKGYVLIKARTRDWTVIANLLSIWEIINLWVKGLPFLWDNIMFHGSMSCFCLSGVWVLVFRVLVYFFSHQLFLGGAPTSICHFFHPSVHPSVAHHISGTVHHLIIIFGTHV